MQEASSCRWWNCQLGLTDKSGKSKEITYFYAGNRLTAQEETETGEYLTYHFNNVGSTLAVTTESCNVKFQFTYSPYGDLIIGNYGEVLFMYNGQFGVQSDGNGLYYMHARYYNADIKRFVNQDILTGTIDSSQSLNRYAYVEGNPVSFLDPFGLEKELADWQRALVDILKLTIKNVTKGGTVSKSIALDGAALADGGIGISIALDSVGNLAINYDTRYGVGMFSLGLTCGKTYLNLPDMSTLGITIQMGASFDVGVSLGADYVRGENTDTGQAEYSGYSVSAGIGIAGAAAEGHITVGESYNIFTINIIEWFENRLLEM